MNQQCYCSKLIYKIFHNIVFVDGCVFMLSFFREIVTVLCIDRLSAMFFISVRCFINELPYTFYT